MADIDVSLDNLAGAVFVRFLHQKGNFFRLPSIRYYLLYYLQESYHVYATVRGWGIMLHFFEGGILHKLFGIFLCGIFVYYPPFTYLFNNLYLYEVIIQ